MNYTDNNEILLAISDCLLIGDAVLTPDINMSIRLEKGMRSLNVEVIDKRNDSWNFHNFRYNERVSAGLNGECFKQWLNSIIKENE